MQLASVTLIRPTDYPTRFDWTTPIPNLTWDDVSGLVSNANDNGNGWNEALWQQQQQS